MVRKKVPWSDPRRQDSGALVWISHQGKSTLSRHTRELGVDRNIVSTGGFATLRGPFVPVQKTRPESAQAWS